MFLNLAIEKNQSKKTYTNLVSGFPCFQYFVTVYKIRKKSFSDI